jgi:GAF domain-containing protein
MLHRIGEFVGRITDRTSTIVVTAVCATIVFGCLVFFGHLALVDSAIDPALHAGILAVLVGLGAGLATLVLLLARRERRRMLEDELRRLAELNHRVRNNLQVIADAHYTAEDATHRMMIMQAVASMDESLKQLFPALGFEHRKQARP